MSQSPKSISLYGAEPCWSPDGTTIVVSEHQLGYNLRLCNSDGSNNRLLVSEVGLPYSPTQVMGWSPIWTRDSERIIFHQDRCLVVVSLKGEGRIIFEFPMEQRERCSISHFALSPDGKWITFITDKHELFIVNIDNGSIKRKFATQYSYLQSLSWSYDGQWISFNGGHQIIGINVDSGVFHTFAESGSNPAWSPNSNILSYIGGIVILAMKFINSILNRTD